MTTDPTTSSSGGSNASQSPAAQKTNSLGEDAFMQLLVTQLKNQDPTQPQDGSAFVAQLAQFTQLEKLTSMNETLNKLTSIDASLTNISQVLTTLGGAAAAATETTSTTQS
jgi:flagellar basal-body rod modification protein FlgD